MIKVNHVYGQQQQSTKIDCGRKFLPETIGLSKIDEQFLQIKFENKILSTIIYENRHQRIMQKQTETNDGGLKKIHYKMNLIDGHEHRLDELIPYPDIYKQIIQSIQYKFENNENPNDNNEQKMYAIIMLDNDRIRFFSYDTSPVHNHYLVDYKSENLLQQIDISNMKFKNETDMVAVSDGQRLKLITYRKNDYSIRIGTFMEKDLLLYRLYIDLDSEQNQFISMTEKLENLNDEKIQKYRENIQKFFAQYQFKFGFIETFVCSEDVIEQYEEDILFLFSNEKKKILTLNIGDIFTGQYQIPFYLQDYSEFFHCKPLTDDDDENVDNNNNGGDNKLQECYQKRPTNTSLFKKYKLLIIISISIIIIVIIIPLFLIIITGRCNYKFFKRCFNPELYHQQLQQQQILEKLQKHDDQQQQQSKLQQKQQQQPEISAGKLKKSKSESMTVNGKGLSPLLTTTTTTPTRTGTMTTTTTTATAKRKYPYK